MEVYYDGYPVFKGLQKPLELMGIRGKFLYYLAATIGIAFMMFVIVAIIVGQLYGILAMAITAAIGYIFVFIKQKEGLHSKKKYKGIVLYKNILFKEN